MTDVTDEVAHYTPPGVVNSIAILIAHVATELDFYIIGMTAGKEPLTHNYGHLYEVCTICSLMGIPFWGQ